jgi:2-hydroxychromene-2-carboxylate isomerase
MSLAIDFYFDFISPYAYVAWVEVQRIATQHQCTLHAHPVLFAALLDAHGTKGPAEVPAKRVYVFKDAFRKAHKAGLPPLTPPPSHPFNPLHALRAVTTLTDPVERARLITALYAATWAGGGGTDGLERVRDVANAAGLAGDEIATRAAAQPAKDAVRASTERALANGAFGVPTMIYDGELFWGVDSLPHLSDRITGNDPLPADVLARWSHLPASAIRPGSH